MKAHILFLGGTGARIYRALIHCMASGMYHGIMPNDLEICAYMIDPDTDNGDGCRTDGVHLDVDKIQQRGFRGEEYAVACGL